MYVDSYLFKRGLIKQIGQIEYEMVDVLGHEALLSDIGFAAVNGEIGACKVYWLRGGLDDDPEMIAAVETKPVIVNFCGMILTDEDLGIDPETGYLPMRRDDFGWSGNYCTIDEFLLRHENKEEKAVDPGDEKSGRYTWGD